MNSSMYFDVIKLNSMARLNRIRIIYNEDRINYLVKHNLISKDSYDQVIKLYDIANEIYPNECDLQLSITPVRTEIKNKSISKKPFYTIEYKPSLIIHFPSFITINSKSEKITVKDFFVRINFFMNDNTDIINIYNIQGTRTTFSYADYSSGYRWSHLANIKSLAYPPCYTDFCFGDGDIPKIVSRFNHTFDDVKEKLRVTKEEVFKLLLLSIEPYLNWESLEGGPHHRMSDVFEHGNIWTSDLVSNEAITSMTKIILKYHKSKIDCDIIYSNGLYQVVDNQKFDTSIANIILSNTSESQRKNLIFKKSSDGMLYDIRSINSDINTKKIKISNIPVIFKQKDYFCSVDSEHITLESDNYYTNPLLKEHAKSSLDYTINYENSKSGFIKRLQNNS